MVDTIRAGIGMVPNDHIAQAAGIACANGIIVDQYCRTSDPLIFAAGDAAINADGHGNALFRLESWQNAQQQGIAAARGALGIEDPYRPRSEEHTSELQSLMRNSYAVFCLKKNRRVIVYAER